MSCFKKPASGAPRDDGGDGGTEGVESVLTMPATGIDPDWRERIDLAKRARQDGKKLREGKPIMFRTSPPLRLGHDPIALVRLTMDSGPRSWASSSTYDIEYRMS